MDKDRYRVLFGRHDKIAADLSGKTVADFSAVSMARVLRQFRVNAKHAGIPLPEHLTVAEDEPGYKEWRAEIRAHRKAAGARLAKDLEKA